MQAPPTRAEIAWSPVFGPPAAIRLSDYFRPALRAHFARLNADDLFLRFGTHAGPETLDNYVAGIDFDDSIVLGVFDDDLDLVGAAHLGRLADGGWELGLNVLAAARHRGVGTLLLRQAVHHARATGALRIVVHCLAENRPLRRLVKKIGAQVVEASGDAEGVIAVSPGGPFDQWLALLEDQGCAIRFGLKAQLAMARCWWPGRGRSRLPAAGASAKNPG